MNNMENKLNLSVILPVKSSLVRDFDEFFKKAIQSIQNQSVKPNELVIVHSSEKTLIDYLESFDFGDLEVSKIEFKDEPNYSSQINLGVKSAKSEWVSLFEFDDEYSQIWFKNVKKYSEIYTDVDAFLPVVVDVDNKSVFAGFTNEASFAANFSQEVGFLTNETLLSYQNFQSAGMVIKKSVFEDFGGFKSSVKLTFVYEFFLRMTYNSAKIMTIPKIGYKHTNLRENSIFWDYKNGDSKLSEDEVKFWISSAKKEYFFVNDRNIKYTEENA
jgi:glycosyltransferase involved in cell wall biosynthesis